MFIGIHDCFSYKQPREWGRVSVFLSCALVSSLLGGVEEKDKNFQHSKKKLCFLSFSSDLSL